MVSESELLNRLREILGGSDLDTATTGSIRRQLEEEFGVDLHDRKGFIRDQIDIFLQTPVPKSANDDPDPDPQPEEGEGNDEETDTVEEEEESEMSEEEIAIKKKRSKNNSNDEKKKGSGFTKPNAISPQLQEIVGEPEMGRTEVVKRIWAYIRENELQNPKDKRKITCDEKLHAVFRVKSINMFKMNAALSNHIWPIEESVDENSVVVDSPQRGGKPKRSRKEDVDEEPKKKSKQTRKPESKQQTRKPSGFLAPLPMSDALIEFFDTGDDALSRADVVKRMWKYIKENDLQDPEDRRQIICDDKLKKLFNVESFTGFTMSKLLSAHFVKPDK